MKKIIYLLTALFFVSCTSIGKHDPYPVAIYETAGITFSDKTTLSFGPHVIVSQWSDSDSDIEYYYQRQMKEKDEVLVIFARSKKYSYELNPDLKELVAHHIPGRTVSEISFTETDFYKPYQVKINENIIFENKEAKSETAWSNWMNDLNARDIRTGLSITLKPDNTLESYKFTSTEKLPFGEH